MKFQVRSGELNITVNRDLHLKDWTEQDIIDVIKIAFEKDKRKELQLGTLLSISAIPFSINEVYYLETKSALQKAGLMKQTEVEKNA